MDTEKVGRRIAELRKKQGMTQKELAEKLHVTDGAVSKWERGINFPDLLLIEPLASALGTSVIEILSLENATNGEVASVITDLSITEKEKLIRELKQRAYINIGIGIVLAVCLVTASLIFKKYSIYGLAHGVTIGAVGFVGTMIGSEIYLIRNIGKVK